MLKRLPLVSLGLTILLWSGCSPDEFKASVPAYLEVPGFQLETNYNSQGSAHSNFTTVWVFYDNEAIGAFDLPCTVPIIPKEGVHELLIYPGITMNGIDASRAIYSMCEPITEMVTLNPLDTFRFNASTTGIPVTRYTPSTTVSIVEDFDQSGINLEPTLSSDTSVIVVSDSTQTFHFPNEDNGKAGLLLVKEEFSKVELISSDAYTLPRGRDVYLEMTYKSNNSVLVGIVGNDGVQVPQATVLLFSTDGVWKKAYINYINEIGLFNQGTSFNVLLGSLKDADVDTAKVYIDNLKLVYR